MTSLKTKGWVECKTWDSEMSKFSGCSTKEEWKRAGDPVTRVCEPHDPVTPS